MQCISFDALRTLSLPDTRYLKPELLFAHRADIEKTDWVLFPEYWQLGALQFGLKARIFPSLSSYLLGHNKIEMTRAFQVVAPRHVPWTEIAANTPSQAEAIWELMPRPFVAKIPKSSMGQGVFLIENDAQWQSYRAQTDVLYVQELLPIDRDLRIIVVGNRVVNAFWRLQGHDGFHNNLSQGGSSQSGDIPPQALQLALTLAKQLDINHAGFDIAMVGDHPYVFEFNRLFGNTGLPELHDQVAEAILHYLRTHHNEDDDPKDPLGPEPPLPVAV